MVVPPPTVTTPQREATLADPETVPGVAATSSIGARCDTVNRPRGRVAAAASPPHTGGSWGSPQDHHPPVRAGRDGPGSASLAVRRAVRRAPRTVGVVSAPLDAPPAKLDAPPTVWGGDPPPVPAWAAAGPVRVPPARRSPRWLPLPVLVCVPFAVAEPLAEAVVFPIVGAAALIVAVCVAATIRWVGRDTSVDPQLAVAGAAWGATVAVTAAVVAASLIISASPNVDGGTYITTVGPVIEEVAKAGFVWWCLRRLRTLHSPLEGIVAAWWCAAGFAFVENIGYFYDAALSGELATVFVVRGVASPFAHLLFGTVVGATAGYAGQRCWTLRRSASTVAVATIAAAFLHGSWNRIAYTAAEGAAGTAGNAALIAGAVGFVIMFWALAAAVAVLRDAEGARGYHQRQCAEQAHPALVRLGEGERRRVAALLCEKVDDADEGERQIRLAVALRDAAGRSPARGPRAGVWRRSPRAGGLAPR